MSEYLIKFDEVNEYGEVFVKGCFKNNTMAKETPAYIPEMKGYTYKELMEKLKGKEFKPFVPIERHEGFISLDIDNLPTPTLLVSHDEAKLNLDTLCEKYKYPKGLLKSDGSFEMCPPGYPEDLFYQRSKYGFRHSFNNSALLDEPNGNRRDCVFAATNNDENEWRKNFEEECKKYNWLQPFLKPDTQYLQDYINRQQKTTDMNKKQIALENVVLNDDERDQVSKELQLDKDAMTVANELAHCIRGRKFEEKKRVLKFLVLAVDAQYELEKKQVEENIKKLEDVLLEKNSKTSAASEFLK